MLQAIAEETCVDEFGMAGEINSISIIVKPYEGLNICQFQFA